MTETGFNPPKTLLPRIAPTERCADQDAWPCKRPDAAPLRGVVHDPTARRMGGIAGHAGLFSTARDLQRFVRMLINGGQLGGVRVLSAATVRAMTSPATPAGMTAVRGLGWDIDSPFSSNRGDLFPIGSYGHTGIHGHEPVDRSVIRRIRDLSFQPSPSRRHRRRHTVTRPGRDGRCRGDYQVVDTIPA